jgi:hypothetical protein
MISPKAHAKIQTAPTLENPRLSKAWAGTIEVSVGGNLFASGVVAVADHAGDFPGAVFELPEVNELSFADSLGVFVAEVVEAVNAQLSDSGTSSRVTLPRMFFLTLSVKTTLPRVTPPWSW